METDARGWIAALRRSQDRLASLVQPLNEEQLQEKSYHDWTIAQVLGHLGSQAEIFTLWLEAGVQNSEPPGMDVMQPIWDAWTARSPGDVATDSIRENESFVRRFEGLTGDELTGMHLNLFGMELDAANFARLRLAEHALHSWDIDVALDPNAQVARDAVYLLIDTLGFLANRAGKPQGKTFRLQVRTSAPEELLALTVGDEVELGEWVEGASDGELRIPAEAMLRLVYGRLDEAHTPAVEITAPDISMDDLRGVFPGV